MCTVGRVNMCLSVRRMGVEYDGAFASEVLVPARNLIRWNRMTIWPP